jgi:phenylalanyl-tRNA synthetase beta chain
MRVSFDWLKDFVKIDDTPELVAEKLTMLGLEIEALERVDGDVVFEVNVTPNRPDCLSIMGIARELSATYGIPFTFPDLNVVSESKELDFNVEILEPDLCQRYAGRIVHNLKVGPSPDWMKKRIEKCGIRSINNVVDVTNYVLLEFGHPLHAFDLSTIKGHLIRVGTPKVTSGQSNMKFTTLDGTEREISGETLLIWDAEKPIAIAGVMGGRDTEVTEKTVDIFIESAYFEPTSIRRTSKTLGLKTESSYRFERGTDLKALKKALDRAAMLMHEVAGGTIYGKIDIYPKRFFPKQINVRYERVSRLLGVKLSEKEVLDCLQGLGLEIYEQSSEGFKVKVPPFRGDITMEADIIEEVARLYGYDKIPAELPKARLGADSRKENISSREIRRDIRESLLKCGFDEAINLSFMGAHELALLSIPGDDTRRNLVQVRNPLREEDAYMRTTLVPALIRNLVHNLAHGNRELSLFEIAKAFIGTDRNSLPEEKERVAALYYREKTKTLYKDNTPDFFVVKGILDAMLEGIGLSDHSYVRSGEPFLHPGRSADIMIDGSKAGFIGELSPTVIEALDIKAQKPSVIVIEIDLGAIISLSKRNVVYKPLPKYPFVERDTAVVVDVGLLAAEIIGHVKAYPSGIIEDVSIFDIYQGGNIEVGKKSIAFNVRYRSPEKTLTDEEVEGLHKAIVDDILEKTGGQLRI